MIVAELLGAMPFACSAGVRPGIFLHGEDSRATVGHGEVRYGTRRSAAGDHFAATSRSPTACRAAARNCLGRQGDSLIRLRNRRGHQRQRLPARSRGMTTRRWTPLAARFSARHRSDCIRSIAGRMCRWSSVVNLAPPRRQVPMAGQGHPPWPTVVLRLSP